MNQYKTFLFSFFCWALWLHTAMAQPRAAIYYQWQKRGHIILHPAFSQNAQDLAFVIKPVHDSLKPAPQANLKETWLFSNDSAQRKTDPVVAILSVATNELLYVDYGWTPRFSPEGKKLVYARQQRPLQNNKATAAALKGNSIMVFNRETRAREMLAAAPEKFLLEPVFSDSSTVVYKNGDAVNGPFAGGIGLSKVDIGTRKITTLLLPEIKHQFYRLVGDIVKINQRLAYVLYSPEEDGKGMADEYEHLLVSAKDTLHHFGTRKFRNMGNKIGVNSGHIIYLDDNHQMPEDTNYLVKYSGDDIVSKTAIPFEYDRAFLSPGGGYLLCITNDLQLYLLETKNFDTTSLALPLKEVHTVAWSPNEERLAIVQDHPALSGTDIMYLLKVEK